jgi:hypothetical protein
MKIKRVEVDIKGTRPMLMHNGRLVDPLDDYTKALAKVTGKRGKTEEDHIEMSDIEWEAGLYWRDDLGTCMPSDNIFAMILAAAKKFKQGPKCIGIQVEDDAQIVFKDSKKLDKLKKNPDCRFRKAVKVGTSKVMRTRPKLPAGWTSTIVLELDCSELDVEDLEKYMEVGGKRIGLGDWRPQKYGSFGKFEVLAVRETD